MFGETRHEAAGRRGAQVERLEGRAETRLAVEIGPNAIRLRRNIGGVDSTVTVPTASYRGVTLRAGARGIFEIVLLHIDPGLDVVLASASDDSDVIADWRRYGRKTNLPLLVEDASGRLTSMIDAPAPRPSFRRGGSPLKGRRPRFLARRKAG